MLKILGKILKWIFYFFLFILLFAFPGGQVIIETVILLGLGWIKFLSQNFDSMEVNPWLFAEAALAIIILIIAAHYFLRWLYANLQQAQNDETKVWRWQWTISGVILFLLMFVTSIAFTGSIHQILWLAREPELTESSFDHYMNRADVAVIRGALFSYYEQHHHFPIAENPVPLSNIALANINAQIRNKDRWGNPFIYTSDGNSYTLRSYGKNRVLGAGSGDFDDLIFTDKEKLH